MDQQFPTQPIEHTFENPISPEKKINWMKVIFGIVGGIIILVIGIFIGVSLSGQKNDSAQMTPNYAAPTTALPTTMISEAPVSITPTAMSTIEGWESYDDTKVSFQYPPEWTVYTDSQVFENGDIVQVRIVGATQGGQTEFYDGAYVSFMQPLASTTSLNEYINTKHAQSETLDPDTYKQDTVQIGSQTYERVYACGLGCFTYHYYQKNGMIYGIVTFAEGPLKDQYSTDVSMILKSSSFK